MAGAYTSFEEVNLGSADQWSLTRAADTLELTNILRERFGQDRIFFSGQSWGSALGFMTIAQDSSPFRAFIPTSEREHWHGSMKMGFEWAIEVPQVL